MFPRILSIVAISAVLIFFLQREASRGGLDALDRIYLDWLIDNNSKRLQEHELTFLRLTDADANVFEEWPPSPLDYAVILKNLLSFDPRLVLFEPTLAWRDDDGITTGALRNQILRTPEALFGCVLQDNPVSGSIPPETDPVRRLETITSIIGDIDAIPSFTGMLTLPEEAFLGTGKLGFTHIDLGPDDPAGSFAVPLLARRDDTVVASFTLNAILLQSGRDSSDLRVRLGDSIEIRDTDIRIPIDPSGYFTVFPGVRDHIAHFDAEAIFDLALTPDKGATASPDFTALKNTIVLIGADHDAAQQIAFGKSDRISRAERIAIALATIQSGRYIAPLLPNQIHVIWGIVILASILLLVLHLSRRRIFAFSLLLILLYGVASLILFQSRLLWMSPAVPVAILLAAGICGLLLPSLREEIPNPKATPSPKEDKDNDAKEPQKKKEAIKGKGKEQEESKSKTEAKPKSPKPKDKPDEKKSETKEKVDPPKDDQDDPKKRLPRRGITRG